MGVVKSGLFALAVGDVAQKGAEVRARQSEILRGQNSKAMILIEKYKVNTSFLFFELVFFLIWLKARAAKTAQQAQAASEEAAQEEVAQAAAQAAAGSAQETAQEDDASRAMDEGSDSTSAAESEQQKVPCGARSSRIFSSSPILPNQQGDEAQPPATAPNTVPPRPLAQTPSAAAHRFAVRENPGTPVMARHQVDGSREFNLTIMRLEDQNLAMVCWLSRLCVAMRFFSIKETETTPFIDL